MDTTQYIVDQNLVALIVVMFIVTILVMIIIGIVWWLSSARTNRIEERIARQIEEWAQEDLEIKRAKLAPSISVPDTLEWLSRVVTRATGAAVKLNHLAEPDAHEPKYLRAEDDEGRRYLLSATTPKGLRRYKAPSRLPWASRIERYGARHSLVPLPRGAERYELTTLNCGITFDLEAAQVWERAHKEPLLMNELWLYVLPPLGTKP